MPKTRRACWRKATKPEFNDLPPVPPEDPSEEDGMSEQQMADIERILELIASAECATGTDYSDGPMSPSGCHW